MTSRRLKAIFASAALGISAGLMPQSGTAMSREQNRELDSILETIQSNFVFHDKVSDREKLERTFLGDKKRSDDFTDKEFAEHANELVASLDPHSHYFDAKATERWKQSSSGFLVGLGIQLKQQAGQTEILKVYPNSPAEHGGLKKGDILLHIHDEARKTDLDVDDDVEKVVDSITGIRGTPVEIRVKRPGVEQPITLSFRRDRVEIDPVAYEFDNEVGYIKLAQFNEKAASGIRKAIAAIEKAHGAQRGYIFDLRNNPGGDVAQAMDILSAFATSKAENVITMKGAGLMLPNDIDQADNLLKNKRLIVLIDDTSVSASELTSGALKDLGRAEIYGNQSYGKGSAWTPSRMPSGNILGVTFALYYLPSGKSIQLQGVVPNVLYVPTAKQLAKALEANAKTVQKLKEKFPNDPDKQVVYNEASSKNALVPPDPSAMDHSKPAQSCRLIAETPAAGTPKELIMESEKAGDPKTLDSIKTCAWESLTGRRLNTRIAPYQGENLRFTPPAP